MSMNIIALLISGVMFFTNSIVPIIVVAPTTVSDPGPALDPKGGTVNLKLDQVLLYDNTTDDRGKKMEFDLFINRMDLNGDGSYLQQSSYDKEGVYTVDLPELLQPETMYVTNDLEDFGRDSGSSCDIPRFPHRCSISFDASEKFDKPEYKFLVKITFKDGKFRFKEVTVSTPQVLQNPEITFPTSTPAQNSKLFIKFKDVGAKHYEVSANLCKPYGNDGINPCLNGTTYYLEKKSGAWAITRQDDLSKATLKVANGIIEISSDLNISYEESVVYAIKAYSSGTLKDGTKTYVESHASKSFPKN